MKFYTLHTIILFTILWTGCSVNQKKIEPLIFINVEGSMGHMEDINALDIGENISYIPLETTDESVIGKGAYVRLLKDRLIVGSYQQPIKLFDRTTGKFIRTIGKIGQGPNEYTLESDIPIFWADEELEIIYVKTSGNRILRFNKEGNPLSEVVLTSEMGLGSGLQIVTFNNILYAYKRSLFIQTDSLYDLIGIELPENEVRCRIQSASRPPLLSPTDISSVIRINGYRLGFPISPMCNIFQLKENKAALVYSEQPFLWIFKGSVYCKREFNDTIFHISGCNQIPRYVFNLGNWHCPIEESYHIDGCNERINIYSVLEGEEILFFTFQTGYYDNKKCQTYYGVFNKKDQSVKIGKQDKTKITSNGIPIFLPQTVTIDGKFVSLVDAAAILEYVDTNESILDNKTRAELAKVTEEDNPVVVIVE